MSSKKSKYQNDATTIYIPVSTAERLTSIGKMRDTYNDVIIMLLDFYELNKISKGDKNE